MLAAITITGYRGAQERAYNVQVIEGVRQYKVAIEGCVVAKGYYPQASLEVSGQRIALTCLGQGYASSYCGRASYVEVYEDTLFNQ